MFFNTYLNMACVLHLFTQSRNNNNRPNKKNDVITDLGGEGDFPMFLSRRPISPDIQLAAPDMTLASLQRLFSRHPASQWMSAP